MKRLWKKESNAADAIHVDLFGAEIPTETKFLPMKSNDISKERHNEGNVLYNQNLWSKAMVKYNESLCFAEIGTKNVYAAYVNRSRCFFRMKMYEQGVIDIELAKKANCPHQLIQILEDMRASYMETMKRDDKFKLDAPKLSYDADEHFPEMANVLEIKKNDEFGRHIVAKCDIPVGKIVLFEEKFSLVTTKGCFESCTVCGKFDTNLIACQQCTGAMFCGDECMKQGQQEHAVKCGVAHSDNLEFYKQFSLTSIGMAIEAFESVEELMESVEEVLMSNTSKEIPESIADLKSKYRLSLDQTQNQNRNTGDCDPTSIAGKIYHSISSLPLVRAAFDSTRKQRFLMHLLTHHLSILNGYFFGNMTEDEDEEHKHRECRWAFIPPLFNHHCVPNVQFIEHGNKVIGMIQRPVKKGDQLFVSYICTCCYKETSVRREYLEQEFHFWCKCDKCEPKKRSLRDLDLIHSNSNFRFIMKNYDRDGDILLNRNRMMELRNKSIEFLNKFGRLQFSQELAWVLDAFNFTNKF